MKNRKVERTIDRPDRYNIVQRNEGSFTKNPDNGEERLLTPRISLLSDNRVAVLCDTNDFHHCHEKQPTNP